MLWDVDPASVHEDVDLDLLAKTVGQCLCSRRHILVA